MYNQDRTGKGIKSNFFDLCVRRVPKYRTQLKRVFDISICTLLLPTLLPLIFVFAVMARRDGGPAFFAHQRVGQSGLTFMCWKIRTMVPDAQMRLSDLLESNAAARKEWVEERKLTNDPRITKIGAFLRKSSLDELPQIWNVFRGEMSLIGPRPVPEDELNENYGTSKWVYKSIKPGVTGLWQVSGRNDVTYAERIRMDIDYYENISLSLDVMILFKTVGAVLNRTGK